MASIKKFNGKRYEMATSTITRGVAMELTKREADSVIKSKKKCGYLTRKTLEAGGYTVWIRKNR